MQKRSLASILAFTAVALFIFAGVSSQSEFLSQGTVLQAASPGNPTVRATNEPVAAAEVEPVVLPAVATKVEPASTYVFVSKAKKVVPATFTAVPRSSGSDEPTKEVADSKVIEVPAAKVVEKTTVTKPTSPAEANVKMPVAKATVVKAPVVKKTKPVQGTVTIATNVVVAKANPIHHTPVHAAPALTYSTPVYSAPVQSYQQFNYAPQPQVVQCTSGG